MCETRQLLNSLEEWCISSERDVFVSPLSSSAKTVSFDDHLEPANFRRNIVLDAECVKLRETLSNTFIRDVSRQHEDIDMALVCQTLKTIRLFSENFLIVVINCFKKMGLCEGEKIGKAIGELRPMDVTRCYELGVDLCMCCVCGKHLGGAEHQGVQHAWTHEDRVLRAHVECMHGHPWWLRFQKVFVPIWAKWGLDALERSVLHVKLLGEVTFLNVVRDNLSPRLVEVDDSHALMVICGSVQSYLREWINHNGDYVFFFNQNGISDACTREIVFAQILKPGFNSKNSDFLMRETGESITYVEYLEKVLKMSKLL